MKYNTKENPKIFNINLFIILIQSNKIVILELSHIFRGASPDQPAVKT